MKLSEQIITILTARNTADDVLHELARTTLSAHFDVLFGTWDYGFVKDCVGSDVIFEAYVPHRFGGYTEIVSFPLEWLDLDIDTFTDFWNTAKKAKEDWKRLQNERSEREELKRLKCKYEPSEGVS